MSVTKRFEENAIEQKDQSPPISVELKITPKKVQEQDLSNFGTDQVEIKVDREKILEDAKRMTKGFRSSQMQKFMEKEIERPNSLLFSKDEIKFQQLLMQGQKIMKLDQKRDNVSGDHYQSLGVMQRSQKLIDNLPQVPKFANYKLDSLLSAKKGAQKSKNLSNSLMTNSNSHHQLLFDQKNTSNLFETSHISAHQSNSCTNQQTGTALNQRPPLPVIQIGFSSSSQCNRSPKHQLSNQNGPSVLLGSKRRKYLSQSQEQYQFMSPSASDGHQSITTGDFNDQQVKMQNRSMPGGTLKQKAENGKVTASGGTHGFTETSQSHLLDTSIVPVEYIQTMLERSRQNAASHKLYTTLQVKAKRARIRQKSHQNLLERLDKSIKKGQINLKKKHYKSIDKINDTPKSQNQQFATFSKDFNLLDQNEKTQIKNPSDTKQHDQTSKSQENRYSNEESLDEKPLSTPFQNTQQNIEQIEDAFNDLLNSRTPQNFNTNFEEAFYDMMLVSKSLTKKSKHKIQQLQQSKNSIHFSETKNKRIETEPEEFGFQQKSPTDREISLFNFKLREKTEYAVDGLLSGTLTLKEILNQGNKTGQMTISILSKKVAKYCEKKSQQQRNELNSPVKKHVSEKEQLRQVLEQKFLTPGHQKVQKSILQSLLQETLSKVKNLSAKHADLLQQLIQWIQKIDKKTLKLVKEDAHSIKDKLAVSLFKARRHIDDLKDQLIKKEIKLNDMISKNAIMEEQTTDAMKLYNKGEFKKSEVEDELESLKNKIAAWFPNFSAYFQDKQFKSGLKFIERGEEPIEERDLKQLWQQRRLAVLDNKHFLHKTWGIQADLTPDTQLYLDQPLTSYYSREELHLRSDICRLIEIFSVITQDKIERNQAKKAYSSLIEDLRKAELINKNLHTELKLRHNIIHEQRKKQEKMAIELQMTKEYTDRRLQENRKSVGVQCESNLRPDSAISFLSNRLNGQTPTRSQNRSSSLNVFQGQSLLDHKGRRGIKKVLFSKEQMQNPPFTKFQSQSLIQKLLEVNIPHLSTNFELEQAIVKTQYIPKTKQQEQLQSNDSPLYVLMEDFIDILIQQGPFNSSGWPLFKKLVTSRGLDQNLIAKQVLQFGEKEWQFVLLSYCCGIYAEKPPESNPDQIQSVFIDQQDATIVNLVSKILQAFSPSDVTSWFGSGGSYDRTHIDLDIFFDALIQGVFTALSQKEVPSKEFYPEIVLYAYSQVIEQVSKIEGLEQGSKKAIFMVEIENASKLEKQKILFLSQIIQAIKIKGLGIYRDHIDSNTISNSDFRDFITDHLRLMTFPDVLCDSSFSEYVHSILEVPEPSNIFNYAKPKDNPYGNLTVKDLKQLSRLCLQRTIGLKTAICALIGAAQNIIRTLQNYVEPIFNRFNDRSNSLGVLSIGGALYQSLLFVAKSFAVDRNSELDSSFQRVGGQQSVMTDRIKQLINTLKKQKGVKRANLLKFTNLCFDLGIASEVHQAGLKVSQMSINSKLPPSSLKYAVQALNDFANEPPNSVDSLIQHATILDCLNKNGAELKCHLNQKFAERPFFLPSLQSVVQIGGEMISSRTSISQNSNAKAQKWEKRVYDKNLETCPIFMNVELIEIAQMVNIVGDIESLSPQKPRQSVMKKRLSVISNSSQAKPSLKNRLRDALQSKLRKMQKEGADKISTTQLVNTKSQKVQSTSALQLVQSPPKRVSKIQSQTKIEDSQGHKSISLIIQKAQNVESANLSERQSPAQRQINNSLKSSSSDVSSLSRGEPPNSQRPSLTIQNGEGFQIFEPKTDEQHLQSIQSQNSPSETINKSLVEEVKKDLIPFDLQCGKQNIDKKEANQEKDLHLNGNISDDIQNIRQPDLRQVERKWLKTLEYEEFKAHDSLGFKQSQLDFRSTQTVSEAMLLKEAIYEQNEKEREEQSRKKIIQVSIAQPRVVMNEDLDKLKKVANIKNQQHLHRGSTLRDAFDQSLKFNNQANRSQSYGVDNSEDNFELIAGQNKWRQQLEAHKYRMSLARFIRQPVITPTLKFENQFNDSIQISTQRINKDLINVDENGDLISIENVSSNQHLQEKGMSLNALSQKSPRSSLSYSPDRKYIHRAPICRVRFGETEFKPSTGSLSKILSKQSAEGIKLIGSSISQQRQYQKKQKSYESKQALTKLKLIKTFQNQKLKAIRGIITTNQLNLNVVPILAKDQNLAIQPILQSDIPLFNSDQYSGPIKQQKKRNLKKISAHITNKKQINQDLLRDSIIVPIDEQDQSREIDNTIVTEQVAGYCEGESQNFLENLSPMNLSMAADLQANQIQEMIQENTLVKEDQQIDPKQKM